MVANFLLLPFNLGIWRLENLNYFGLDDLDASIGLPRGQYF